ncbi:hypothetical protein [Thioalkalivibrio thiocyanodenitrificans]|uniref:hypothetical protein n=1 Tax=Thioalkalivibrio thiocyanodenitrificans TaxID=243063 RepID=UPI00036F4C8B|nr:hypothetical protein [Thioalkalivibrio thiocyanodenitrificans]
MKRKSSEKSLIERILNTLFGERCSACGSRDTVRGNNWTRGWNHLCKQAHGGAGLYCKHCQHIEFDVPKEVYEARLPEWCDLRR